MEVVKKYWMVLVVIATLLILSIIAYFVVTRLQSLTSQSPSVPVANINQPANIPTEVPARADLSFSIDSSITPPPGQESSLSCIELVATPIQGTVPLTVSFTGLAKDTNADSLSFIYTFGDGSSQTVDKLITNSGGVESQDISHTYTTSGSFAATLTVTSSSGSATSNSCAISIQAGGNVALETDPKSVGSPYLYTGSATPTTSIISPTKSVSSSSTISPTKPANAIGAGTPSKTLTPAKTVTPSKTASMSPTPFATTAPQPVIPNSGNLLPSIAAALGGIAIIVLSVLF